MGVLYHIPRVAPSTSRARSTPDPCALLLPVETKTREFDAKLLLAAVAAERGFRVVIGSKAEMHQAAARLPRGLYLAKDLHPANLRMARILRQLGHRLLACEEEGLVRDDRERHFAIRVDPAVLAEVEAVLCWGDDHAELMAGHPDLGARPSLATGNPRIDLLREPLRSLFDDDVAALRQRYGRFVLINTNFGHVNHFVPQLSSRRAGGAAVPQPRDDSPRARLLSDMADYRAGIFERFRALLPRLADALPGHTLVVRPHPAEAPGPWREAAAGRSDIDVVHEGPVAPWLLAADALIHNGCTTAIEAHVLGVPAISFQPHKDARYDRALPDSLSVEVADEVALLEAVSSTLSRGGPVEAIPGHRDVARRHLTGLDGALACDRIVDVLEEQRASVPPIRGRGRGRRFAALHATARGLLIRHVKSRIPGHKNSAGYQAHRFPETSPVEVQRRLGQFSKVLGRFDALELGAFGKNLFTVSRPDA